MGHGTRTLRVAERVREELSTLLVKSVRDPGLAGVTVTAVRMTPDLQLARAWYTVADGADRRDAARGLRRAQPFLRRAVGERLQLRRAPDLQFLHTALEIEDVGFDALVDLPLLVDERVEPGGKLQQFLAQNQGADGLLPLRVFPEGAEKVFLAVDGGHGGTLRSGQVSLLILYAFRWMLDANR